MIPVREADFAVRVVRRRTGAAGIVYRRRLDPSGRELLKKLASISPLAFSAGASLLRAALRHSNGKPLPLDPGPFYALDPDWGARVACYALVAAGLRDPDRLYRAASHLEHADGAEAAWWLGLMTRPNRERTIRAFRILIEAVK